MQYKILVTGAAGFLGSQLAEALSSLGHKVIGIDDDLLGQNICAFVKLVKNNICSENQIIKFCKGKINSYKLPKKIIIIKPNFSNSVKFAKSIGNFIYYFTLTFSFKITS